ncbi:PTS sugar transporter subunit IIB [Cryobacterium sp. SO2]|uniref:PTS sugar transporter subunit IIB n=1 Tax=Cryobacterium sp. SO2 TaxID=1897060 RepID=UPI00223D381A|nr:PTS sugar transporter subunit IIB [Cryobacterium sp. SO2]WEO78722.1 PTS sugar transporter subunit IIB [Cryobacterium sp. SO2]
MRVLLACAAGMSTSLLMNNMRKFAAADDVIDAVPYGDVSDVVAGYDVVLLGPQVKFRLSEAKTMLVPLGKVVDVIDMRAYGTMDGEKVLVQARALLA